MNIFFGGGEEKMKTSEEKAREYSNLIFFFKTTIFGHILKKISTFIFLVHGHSSWSTFGLHLVRGPKALQIDFF